MLSRLAAEVFAIELHRSLADAAARTLERLGYDNVTIRHGDGTRGWDDEAPFDAILVSAGGAEVPTALKEQLAPGGRLVMPVGELGRVQELRLFHKRTDGSMSERRLAAVRFVPLVSTGSEGIEPAGPEDVVSAGSEDAAPEGWEDAARKRRAGGEAGRGPWAGPR